MTKVISFFRKYCFSFGYYIGVKDEPETTQNPSVYLLSAYFDSNVRTS